jgi:hypothetical protein
VFVCVSRYFYSLQDIGVKWLRSQLKLVPRYYVQDEIQTLIDNYKYEKLIFEGDCKINTLPGFKNVFHFNTTKPITFINRSHGCTLYVNGEKNRAHIAVL